MMSLFFILGLAQLMWISVMLAKRGIAPDTLWQAGMPLFCIWVLAWPIYTQTIWLYLPISILISTALISHYSKSSFWQYMHSIWGGFSDNQHHLPWHIFSFILTLSIAIEFFIHIPEFGFGLALTACLAFPLAALLDRTQY